MDGGIAAEYAVKFLHDSTLVISIGCCEATLINEGDLNDEDRRLIKNVPSKSSE